MYVFKQLYCFWIINRIRSSHNTQSTKFSIRNTSVCFDILISTYLKAMLKRKILMKESQ